MGDDEDVGPGNIVVTPIEHAERGRARDVFLVMHVNRGDGEALAASRVYRHTEGRALSLYEHRGHGLKSTT